MKRYLDNDEKCNNNDESLKEEQHQSNTSNKRKHGPRLGKSMLDSGIGLLKRMLSDKCHWADRSFIEVCENYTTQVCSNCDRFTGPKGLRQLGIRTWTCVSCGITHDRDVNSAKNMARIEAGKTLVQSVPRCRHLLEEMNRSLKTQPMWLEQQTLLASYREVVGS